MIYVCSYIGVINVYYEGVEKEREKLFVKEVVEQPKIIIKKQLNININTKCIYLNFFSCRPSTST